MKKIIPLFLVMLLLNSCATLFNTRMEKINIVTSESSTVVLNNIPLQSVQNRVESKVVRSPQNLELIVSSDSITKNVSVNPANSFMFWSNLSLFYGVGMLVDWKNPKRFSYPKTVYVDLSNKENSYSTVDLSKMFLQQ